MLVGKSPIWAPEPNTHDRGVSEIIWGMKTTKRFLASVAFLFFLCRPTVEAQAPKPASEPAAQPAPLQIPELKFEKYRLENGLEVILSEDHRLPLVAVNL